MSDKDRQTYHRGVGVGLVFLAGSFIGALSQFYAMWGGIGAGLMAAGALGFLVAGVWLIFK